MVRTENSERPLQSFIAGLKIILKTMEVVTLLTALAEATLSEDSRVPREQDAHYGAT